jgi:hypothetical protein
MISNPQTRRVLSLVLIATGGLLIFLAPADFWVGTLLLGLGAALEVASKLIQRRSRV